MQVKEKKLYVLMLTVIAALFIAGFSRDGIVPVLKGIVLLQSHPARLLNDYTAAGSEGAAIVNATLVGCIGLLLIAVNRVRLSGPTVAAVFTLIGFGFFGKTVINTLPIILGVFISAKIVSKKFREYIIIALFGTALGPVVTFIMSELGFYGPAGIAAGVAVGVATGILLPSLAIKMLQLHQGYSLYNLGFTCGFLALFAAAIFAATGHDAMPSKLWNTAPSAVLVFMVPSLSVFMLAWGIIDGGKQALEKFIAIQSFSGRLPSDYMEMATISGSLVNMGLLGLGGSLYVYLTGAPFNGPVIGGLLTLIGFGAFGKHVKNSAPVVAGVLIGCLLFGKNPSAPGPVLAALFCTTLAPVAGGFGNIAGITAGIIHLAMVERTGAWHNGLDLYNNGFAGGLTATLLVAIIEWYRANVGNIND